MKSTIKDVFDILFVSNQRFKIEIDPIRLRAFILSYAIFKYQQIKKEEEQKKINEAE